VLIFEFRCTLCFHKQIKNSEIKRLIFSHQVTVANVISKHAKDLLVGLTVGPIRVGSGTRVRLFTARCTLVQSAVLPSHVVSPSVCTSVCLSVRPSVTLVDHGHIGWKSWKLIARTISPNRSLFVAQTPSTYSLWCRSVAMEI